MTTTCRIPACTDAVLNYRHRLCATHYNRAKDRRRGPNPIPWETLLANPALLNGRKTRLLRAVAPTSTLPLDDPSIRSCLTCTSCRPVPPRAITCIKNQWAGIRFVAIAAVEHGGLPSHLVGRARTCPHFSSKP